MAKFALAKVVHLTSVHHPFDTRIFHKECKTLAEAGYEVTLIAPHDRDETVNGVQIRSVPKPKRRRGRMTRTVWQVYRAGLQEGAQVYHFHDPELIPVGLLLKLQGSRVIWDVHEDLPRQILNKYWIPSRLRSLIGKAAEVLESISELGFDGIVATTPTIARRFIQKKTITVQNFPILSEPARSGAQPYTERDPTIVYVGDITASRGVREMVAALNLLPESLEARLALAGKFSPPELEVRLQQVPGWRSVKFLDWQSRDGVAHLLARGRVGLVTLHPTPSYLDSYPVKLFEYMAAGIPVIASDFPLWREIVEGAGCGLLVDPLEPRAIAKAIQWILEHPQQAEVMGKRGREAVSVRYDWDIEARKLLELYKRLAK